MSQMSFELRPDLVKPYLKLITEAIVQLDNNKGSLRKDIWAYLYQKYQDSIDFRDFLLAIRKFRKDGKLLADKGIFKLADEVIQEVKEKTPTPVFKNKFSTDVKNTNMFMNLIGANKSESKETSQPQKSKSSSQREAVSSKISNSGKKQKTKEAGQEYIDKYLQESTIEEEDQKLKEQCYSQQTSKLGFQTPLPVYNEPRLTQSSRKEPQVRNKPNGIHKKQKSQDLEKKKKLHQHQLQQITKSVHKRGQPSQRAMKQGPLRSSTPTKQKRTVFIEPYREAMSQPNFVTRQLEPFRVGSARRGQKVDAGIAQRLKKLSDSEKKQHTKQVKVVSPKTKKIKKVKKQAMKVKKGKTLKYKKKPVKAGSRQQTPQKPKQQAQLETPVAFRRKIFDSVQKSKEKVKKQSSKKEKAKDIVKSKLFSTPETKAVKTKKIAKTKFSSAKKLGFLDKYEKTKYIQRKLEQLKKKLNGYKKYKLDKDRKAKLDAQKTIKQLYINRHVEKRMPVYVAGKLIYL